MPSNEPRSKIRNDKESVEKKEVRTVRKSSRLIAEADEKKRKYEQSRLENEEGESVCLYCFDKYNDGTTYSFRGLMRHQNSGICAQNKLDSHRYSGSADSGSLSHVHTPAIAAALVTAIAVGDLLHRWQ